MNYTVEGFIGEFSLPITTENGALTFKLIPTGDYLRELPDENATDRKERQILLVGGKNKVLLVGVKSDFSLDKTTAYALAPSLVALKTAKAKVRVCCNEKRVVTSVTVL